MNENEKYRKEIKKLARETKYIPDVQKDVIKKRKRKALINLTIKAIIPLGIIAGLTWIFFAILGIAGIIIITLMIIIPFLNYTYQGYIIANDKSNHENDNISKDIHLETYKASDITNEYNPFTLYPKECDDVLDENYAEGYYCGKIPR